MMGRGSGKVCDGCRGNYEGMWWWVSHNYGGRLGEYVIVGL